MSGDLGPDIVVRAAKSSLDIHPNLHIIFVGKESLLIDLTRDIIGVHSRYAIQNATEVVSMSESPSDAVRKRKTHQCELL